MKKLNTKIFSVLLLWLMSSALAFSQYTPNWQLIPEKAKYPKNERVVAGFIVDPGTWGNGAQDCTNDIQAMLNALDKAGNRGQNMWNQMELLGGGVLYMPEGRYKMEGQLVIPKGVTIRGDWKKPVKGQAIEGTVIMAYTGRGVTRANTEAYENASFIKTQSASAIMDVAIWYPDQNPNNIVPYSPTILLGHRGGPHGNEFNNVKNVTLVNSYDGVIFSQIGGTCYTINGLYGTPLNIGVEIDRIVDIGRAEHISFSPMYWAGSGLTGSPNLNDNNFRTQLYDNATGIMMRRNDWSYTLYVDIEGYNKGFWAALSLQQDGSDGLATPNGQNYGFNFSNCKYGIYHESSTGQGSVMYSEVKMAGVEYGIYMTEKSSSVSQLYKGDISATKCAIYSDPASSTKFTLLESTIKAGKVLMQGGTLIAINNDFNNTRPQIELEANSRGTIAGNRFSQGKQIEEKSVFQNVISDEAVDMKAFPAYYEFNPKVTKPAGDKFIVATAAPYNAPRGHKDNCDGLADATTAIQNALNAAAPGGIVYLPPGHYRINEQLTIPSGVELKGSTDVSSFPVGPGSVLEIYNKTSVAVIMKANSGMRGINFNYPEQVYCTVMPDPIEFPFSIQGQGENIYIVNVAMRQSNRGVDLASYACNSFYIDFLTGYFFREGVNIKNSQNGILANMQCNTIVYNSGSEVKFGQFPNSNREPVCANDNSKNPYTFNSRYMTFLTMENVDNILLYGDFNYNALVGMHVKDNVNGLALGFALDDDRTMLYLDGQNIHLDFINLQGVALQREDATHGSLSNDENSPNYGKSTYIRSSDRFTGEVNLFSSAYWGYAGESGLLLNGSGTVNMYAGYFQHAGENSFADVNNGNLNLIGSVVNPANGDNDTYIGDGGNISTIGSVTKNDDSVTGNTNIGQSPEASTSGALNNCNTWTATANYTANGNANNIINCNIDDRWNSGWQNQGQGQNAVTIVIDMQGNQTFNQVILDYGSAPSDGPQTYTLEVSPNNANWTQVAEGSGNSQAMTMIAFPTQTARYIRLTKPASTKNNFYAIDNLYVVNVETSDVNAITAVPDGTPAIGDDEGNTDPIAVTGVTMNNASVLVGNTVTLVPSVQPYNAANKNVTFEIVTNAGNAISLNTNTGVVTGLAVGTAMVRVTTADGNFTATATINVTAPSQCDPIRSVRIQTYGNEENPALFLLDNNGTLNWSAVANDNSAWYEIPVEGSNTDFYYKNVGTERYIYRPGAKTIVDGDWGYETATLSATNAKTALYQFRPTASAWGGRYWLVNVANADFANVYNKGAFILNGGNYNHNIPEFNDGAAVIIGGIPNNTNVWTSTALVVVNASVDNPDCEAQTCNINITGQPQSRTYTIGDNAQTLTVVASNATTYTWYSSTDNANNTPVNDTEVGTNANNFTPNVSTAGTTYYYVKVSNNDCEKLSNLAVITVNNPSQAGDPNYPPGYPKTMKMSNPLFWQFGSQKVSNDDAGVLTAETGNLYTADPSAHVWNINGIETLFVYASHDMEAARGCDRMDRYHVYSTTDMETWTDYGEIVKADDVPWHDGNFINGSKFMWAPDAAYKNGKYYFYFPHPSKNEAGAGNDWGSNWKIGVAVSDHPASDFTILPNYLELNTGFEYDPCVFVDDDGKVYLYYGGGAHPYVVRLKDNMTEIDGTPQVMEGLNNFHEGIWVHKRNGKYYLSYPDNGGGGDGMGDQLKYAVSDSPTGPWESIGAYVYATGCGTIHGSIVEYKGQSYAFYHSDYVSHNGDQGRSVHVDKLYYNADGTIQVVNNWGQAFKGPHNVVATNNTTTIALTLQAEDFNTGGETYGYHDTKNYEGTPTANNSGYRDDATGIAIEARAGGVYNIGDIDRREFLRYTINVEKAGLYDIDCYVASQNNGGLFHLNINGVNKSGEVSVTGNGGWGDAPLGFAKLTVPNIPLKAGENLFEFRVRNTGGFNIDRFEFRIAEPYQGMPYNGPHNVPGKVEAEDFDFGGLGIAYYDSNGKEDNYYAYRTDDPATGAVVDIEGSAGNRINIGYTNGGEWTKYTLNVTETGYYDVTVNGATGNGTGTLSLTFDDIDEYPSISVTTTDFWQTYNTGTLKGVYLTAGTHTMTMTIGGNINVDWYEFVKSEAPVPVESVTINADRTTVEVGQTVSFSANVLPADAANKNVTYSIIGGTGAGNISGNILTANAEGTIIVRVASVADNTKFDDITITVNPAQQIDIPITSITIAADKQTVIEGDQVTFSVQSILPANATNQNVTYAIISGGQYGSLIGSILSTNGVGTIQVQATAADGSGVKSNTITITVEIIGGNECEGAFDLQLLDFTWEPQYPQIGDQVIFTATIKNIGGTATPNTEKHGVSFTVSQGAENTNEYVHFRTTWNDVHFESIAACGGQVVLTAIAGDPGKGGAGADWSPQADGIYQIRAYVIDNDDRNSMYAAENAAGTMANNILVKDVEIGATVGTPEIETDGKSIIAYNSTVEIRGIEEGEVISVYNLLGMKVYSKKAGQNPEYITSLREGLYTVVIEGTKTVQKVMILK
jgi:uncharacterized protein YjdB